MTVTVSKPALNIREELSALKKISGIKGEELLRANTVADVYASLNPTMFRNRIINGDMRIDQRNAGASVSLTTVTGFVVDRWNTVVRPTGGGTITGQQISDAPAGYSNSTRLTVNTADTSLAALDYYFHWQKIEGFNSYDLAFGTSNASPVTLSFWVKSSITGQFSTFLTNATENYTCAIPYIINTANTWERKVVTFSGATAGTWVGSTNGAGIIVGFGLTSGTSLLASPGVWGGAAYGAVGDTNWMATSGNTWQVTGVQLEKGTVATPFEYRPYGMELALCQRYCWVYSGNSYAYARGPVLNVGTTSTIWYTQYPTTMRAAPSLTTNNITSSTIEFSNYTNGVAPTYSASIFNESSIWGGCITLQTTGSAFTAGGVGNWRWTGSPSANFTFSAEL